MPEKITPELIISIITLILVIAAIGIMYSLIAPLTGQLASIAEETRKTAEAAAKASEAVAGVAEALKPVAEALPEVMKRLEAAEKSISELSKTVEELRGLVKPPRVLRVMNYWAGKDKDAFDRALAVFKLLFPEVDVRVTYLGGTGVDYMAALMAKIAAKAPPDVSSMWSGAPTAKLVEEGAIIPLDDVWAEIKGDETIGTVIKEALCMHKGRVYFIPHVYQMEHLVFYNKHTFEQLGLKEPKTWDEFEHILEVCKANGIIPISSRGPAASRDLGELFWAILSRKYGVETCIKLAKGEIPWTSPEVVDVARTIREYAIKGYITRDLREVGWAEWVARVARGYCAMLIRDTWVIKDFEAAGMKPGVDFGIFPLPPMRAGEAIPVFIYADGWVVFKDAKNIEDAKLWVKTMVSVDAQKAHSVIGKHGLTVNTKVPAELYPPWTRAQIEALREAIKEGKIVTIEAYYPPGFQDEMEDVLADLVADIERPVEDILATIEELKVKYYGK